MNRKSVPLCFSIVLLMAIGLVAGEAPTFAGAYADRKFLNGQAVFQMSLEQSGGIVSVWFSAGKNDGSGAAPEAQGTEKASGKGVLEFKFEDSFNNAGTGTITRSGDGVTVSLKTTRVAEPRCLEFYRQNMHLKRVGKK